MDTGRDVRAEQEAYREHYNTTYAGTDLGYRFYEPAYRHGFTYGANPEYRDLDYDEAESAMRRDYEARHGTGTFVRVKDAVRYGFERARTRREGPH
mgnify:FL=1